MGSRRRFLETSALAVAGAALPGRVWAEAEFDLLLAGGTVVDGTGGPSFGADVGVRGGRIAALGRIDPERARRVLDARGLHVSPGFIDIHSHSDFTILAHPAAQSRVLEGVTTELTGNCGSSSAPLPRKDSADRRDLVEAGIVPVWTDVASYGDALDRAGLAIHQALLLGQGTLRERAIGLADRPLSADEMASVLRDVEIGMDQGAFGLSTGLEYTPGRYTPTDEIVAMARVVSRRGGLYASHIRNEETRLLEAVDEAITIGRQARCRVEVSHLKAAGKRNWDRQGATLDLIERARAGGMDVLADAYPYTAYSTTLTILLPGWAQEGGTAAMLSRLRDPGQRPRIRKEVTEQLGRDVGDPALIVISSVGQARNQASVGRRLSDIAADWNVDADEAIVRLIDENEGSVSYVGHAMSPENVARVLADPLVMVGSDGSALAPEGAAAHERPHPRAYGAFARVLAYYVRERKLFSLETAVHKMTAMPADQIGLGDRGRVGRGLTADLVVFDAERVQDVATFEDPQRYAAGFVHVLVNGVPVVESGRLTDARPGRFLRQG